MRAQVKCRVQVQVLSSDLASAIGLKISELHKVIAEKEKYISRLNEQAKAQIQEYKEVCVCVCVCVCVDTHTYNTNI